MTVGVGVLDDPAAQRQFGIFPEKAVHFPGDVEDAVPYKHLISRSIYPAHRFCGALFLFSGNNSCI